MQRSTVLQIMTPEPLLLFIFFFYTKKKYIYIFVNMFGFAFTLVHVKGYFDPGDPVQANQSSWRHKKITDWVKKSSFDSAFYSPLSKASEAMWRNRAGLFTALPHWPPSQSWQQHYCYWPLYCSSPSSAEAAETIQQPTPPAQCMFVDNL